MLYKLNTNSICVELGRTYKINVNFQVKQQVNIALKYT